MPVRSREDQLNELDPEAVLQTVVRYLLAKGETEAAHHLATAKVSLNVLEGRPHGSVRVNMAVEGPVPCFDYLGRLEDANDHELFTSYEDKEAAAKDRKTSWHIYTALQNALPSGVHLNLWQPRLLVSDAEEGWRQDVLRELDGKGGHNQCATLPAEEVLVWRGLRFRSLSEMKVAEALDRARIMFFPNCRARLGVERRGNLEADFLVCHKGTWGMIEVDGEPFHPPTRTVHDHDRDRPFLRHGVKLIQHYDATRCRNEPDAVVAEFLILLEKVGE
jgi:hypothetical protein